MFWRFDFIRVACLSVAPSTSEVQSPQSRENLTEIYRKLVHNFKSQLKSGRMKHYWICALVIFCMLIKAQKFKLGAGRQSERKTEEEDKGGLEKKRKKTLGLKTSWFYSF